MKKIFRANLPHDLHTQTAEGQLNQLNQGANARKLNNIDVYDIRAFHQKQRIKKMIPGEHVKHLMKISHSIYIQIYYT